MTVTMTMTISNMRSLEGIFHVIVSRLTFTFLIIAIDWLGLSVDMGL
jgi:hypothetical protein